MHGCSNSRTSDLHCCRGALRSRMDRGGPTMIALLKSLGPILFLTGLFVAAVYLIKYIIHRIVDHK